MKHTTLAAQKATSSSHKPWSLFFSLNLPWEEAKEAESKPILLFALSPETEQRNLRLALSENVILFSFSSQICEFPDPKTIRGENSQIGRKGRLISSPHTRESQKPAIGLEEALWGP